MIIGFSRMLFVLPSIDAQIDTTGLATPPDAPLRRAVLQQNHDHSGKTDVLALCSGADAFAARMILANTAVSSIDAQYYIWHRDLTGALLLDALAQAETRDYQNQPPDSRYE